MRCLVPSKVLGIDAEYHEGSTTPRPRTFGIYKNYIFKYINNLGRDEGCKKSG